MRLSKESLKRFISITLCVTLIFFVCLGSMRLGLSLKRTIVVGIICLISLCIHCYKSKDDLNYIQKLLGLRQRPDRDFSYDWLRVLAVIMVIITHTIQVDLSLDLVSGKKTIFMLTILYMLCLACNLIYVMLSGALLIPYKEEKISSFYLKRISKVFLPMLIYFVFYLWQNNELKEISVNTIKTIFVRLFQGETPEAPHYWLMYILLSIYIVIPIFRYMFKDMPYKTLTSVVIISIILMTIGLFSPIKFKLTSFLSAWEGVAIIGYWVTRPETNKYYKQLMGLCVIAFIAMVILIQSGLDYKVLCCNTSPIMTLICIGIFSFVFNYSKIFSKGNFLLKILSKYSYSLILVHWWTLHWIARGKCNIQIMNYHGLGLLLSLIVTLFVSLLVAIIIDNFILFLVEQIYNWIVKKIIKNP